MKTLHLSLIMLTIIIFLGFGLKPAHADDANGISIQNIKVQPPTVKVGDTFSVTATLVNNSTVPIVLDGGKCSIKDTQASFFTIMFDNHTKIKSKNLTCAGVGWSQILNPGKNIIGTSPDSTFAYVATESGTANVTVTFQYDVKNQTDPTQSNIGHTISKSFLFTIYDNNIIEKSLKLGNHPVTNKISSPLKQFKSGIAANDVKCTHGLQLVIKAEDNFPACVKPQTAQKLVERGWVMAITSYTQQNIPALSSSIAVPNTNFTINYDFAGNGRILNANMDIQSKSLILSLETTSNGTLTVSIPRALLDIKKNDRGMGEFYILADGRETIFKEIHTTLTDRVFSIPFQDGTKKIQIIATELI